MGFRRRFTLSRRLAPAVAAFVALCACASPTLPLPPPEAPSVAAGPDADHIALTAPCGAAEPSAILVVDNTNPMVANDQAISGTVADPCGSWNVPSVFAHNGDVLNITQQFGALISDSVTVVVDTP